MGSAFQRLEILLIGLVLLIAGAVVVVLLTVHPPTPTVYIQTTPIPLARPSAEPPTTDLTAIAARLSATPCPDKATVQALWAELYEASA